MASAPTVKAVKRVAFVADSGRSILDEYRPLLAEILSRRHTVQALAADFDPADESELGGLGIACERIQLAPAGFTLFPDRQVIGGLRERLSSWQPHVVVGSGERPMVFAALAGSRADVPHKVSVVSRFAAAGSHPPRAGADLAGARYGEALSASTAVVCRNHDDARALAVAKILPRDVPVTVVPGAGVDVEKFGLLALPPLADGLVFLMVAPLQEDKGILDYCEAARDVKRRAPSARFLLAGAAGAGTGAVSATTLSSFAGAVDYVGALSDMRELLSRCHIFVYPPHQDGMPARVLEALAAGRPIVTTDVPGCRETVDERVNGCLVPVGDPAQLAAALETFLKRPDLIPAAAKASRVKAERRFAERAAVLAMMDVLGLA